MEYHYEDFVATRILKSNDMTHMVDLKCTWNKQDTSILDNEMNSPSEIEEKIWFISTELFSKFKIFGA